MVDPVHQNLEEHAQLVARGVREIATLGSCEASPEAMLRTATRIEAAAPVGAIPFVLDQGHGRAVYGYAGHAWSLDLFRWVIGTEMPEKQRSRILGLLHGYDGEAIRSFEERGGGRLWVEGTASDGLTSSDGQRTI